MFSEKNIPQVLKINYLGRSWAEILQLNYLWVTSIKGKAWPQLVKVSPWLQARTENNNQVNGDTTPVNYLDPQF